MRRLFSALMTLALLGLGTVLAPATAAYKHTAPIEYLEYPDFTYTLLPTGYTKATLSIKINNDLKDKCIQRARDYLTEYSHSSTYNTSTCTITTTFKPNESPIFKLTPLGNNLYSLHLEEPNSYYSKFIKKHYPEFTPYTKTMNVKIPLRSIITFGLPRDNISEDDYFRRRTVYDNSVSYTMMATMPYGIVRGTVELDESAAKYFPKATATPTSIDFTPAPTLTPVAASSATSSTVNQGLSMANIVRISAALLATAALVAILLKRKTASATAGTTSTDSPASR